MSTDDFRRLESFIDAYCRQAVDVCRADCEGGRVSQIKQSVAEAHAVIDTAIAAGAKSITPLYSGGHDSQTACLIASQHGAFSGEVFHIDTGIGARDTRAHVEDVCAKHGWKLRVFKSNFTYERFVMAYGFPSPGAHGWIYNRLKDRAIYGITKGRGKTALITGCRQHESQRRMGHVEPLQIGEVSKKTGTVRNTNRLWTAPCWNWTSEMQRDFLDSVDAPRNPIKMTPLAMSGECFCGAFARPNEIVLIQKYAPDVAEEIGRLEYLAKPRGGRCRWGSRAPNEKGVIVAPTGPMCSSCDYKAAASGIILEDQCQ